MCPGPQVGVYCLSGPLVGALVSTHGCRPVCVAGAVLASLGLLAGSFAPSLSVLIWCYRYMKDFKWSVQYDQTFIVW